MGNDWKCENCGELHNEQFDACWNCGTTPTAEWNSKPEALGPETFDEQTGKIGVNGAPLPRLGLPDFWYFSVPPFVATVFLLAVGRESVGTTQSNADPFDSLLLQSPMHLAMWCVFSCLIGLPMLIAAIHAMWLCIIHRRTIGRTSDLWWLLSMFKLPESIRLSRPWFTPLYYGSIVALHLAPIGHAWWLFTASR